MQQFGSFCIDFHAKTKLSKTPQNMSIKVKWCGLVALFLKNCDTTSFSELARFHTSSAPFVSIFVQKENCPKHTKTWVLGQMECRVHCEKLWRNFVWRTCSVWHMFSMFCIDFRAVTKRSETPQNMSFGSNEVDWVRSLQKIATQLHLAKFLGLAPVRPILHRFTCGNKTIQNTPKHEY